MLQQYFRFDFKGREGARSNSFITLKHDRPDYGEVKVGLSHKEDDASREQALAGLSDLSQSLNKKVRRYSWNYYDAVLVETDGFDMGLGVLFSSRLEKQGVVPKGSTEKFKAGLKAKGHKTLDKDLTAFMELMEEDAPAPEEKTNGHEKQVKEKKRVFRLFRKRKQGLSK